jgi:integrase/recombinase XerC
VFRLPVSRLTHLTDGLSSTWAAFLRDWDRSLRAANHPETTLWVPKTHSAF